MKKIILSAAALFIFGFANAQDVTVTTTTTTMSEGGKGFSSGDVFLSGAVGFTSDSFGDSKSNTFTVAPKAGFFVSDNIAVGVAFRYRGETDETEYTAGDLTITIEEESSTLSVGAFARYYATPASDFSFFGELGFNYNTTNSNDGEVLSEDVKFNGFDITLSPGVSYFISEHFVLEASIGALSYETTTQDIDDADDMNTFNIGLDLTDLTIGLLFKF